MACGTPMVSFKIGGVPDLVRPGITGYLASPEDPEDFRNGIIQLLENAHTIDSQHRNLCDRSSSSNLFKPSYLFSTSHPNPGLAIDILLGTFSINPTQKHQRQIKTQWKIKTDSLLRLKLPREMLRHIDPSLSLSGNFLNILNLSGFTDHHFFAPILLPTP
jgi:hypothetical protein